MKNLRAPEFLNGLYRDLRDRRLLLPTAALLVALIAVPVLLSSSSSSTSPPPPVASPDAAKATAAEPAVLTEQLGVTDYRKRLESFKKKNPFRQHFAVPKVTSKVSQSSATTPSLSTGPTSISGGSSSISGGSSVSTSAPSTTSSPPAGSSATAPSSSTPPSSSNATTHEPKPKTITEQLSHRIDVKIGAVGSLVEKDDVKQLTMLPNAANPLVAFLGTTEDGKRAYFLVSTDVAGVSGDGICLSTTPTCQVLSLKAGQVETFDYTPDPGTPYKLRLLAIHDHVVKRTTG